MYFKNISRKKEKKESSVVEANDTVDNLVLEFIWGLLFYTKVCVKVLIIKAVTFWLEWLLVSGTGALELI